MNITPCKASILLLIIFLSITSPSSHVKATENPCLQCHIETYEKAISNPYVHSVVEDECAFCHIVNDTNNTTGKNMMFSIGPGESLLRLGTLEKRMYQLQIIDTERNKDRPLLLIINGDDLETREYPPLNNISNVKVKEVKKGPYVSARISWDTDEFATSEVEYSTDGRNMAHAARTGVYVRNHTITVRGLKHKRMYTFRAVSRDLHGTVLRSDEFTVNTSEEFSQMAKKEKSDRSSMGIHTIRPVNLSDMNHLCLNVSSHRPAEISVTLMELSDQEEDKHGSGLTSARYVSMDVCFECHEQNASHPVGSAPRDDKIVIPDNLPTIEDKIMTCVTCHYAHGGGEPYFARLDFSKKICVTCHKEGYGAN